MPSSAFPCDACAMRARGSGCVYRRGGVWWISYYAGGKHHYESAAPEIRHVAAERKRRLTEREQRTVAERLLRLRLGQKEGRALPTADKVRVQALADIFFQARERKLPVDEHHRRRAKVLHWERLRWRKHLEPIFGGRLAGDLRRAILDDYVTARLRAGASNGSVNREMALLRVVLRHELKQDAPRISRVPAFPPRLSEKPRTGFAESDQYLRLQRSCRLPWLKAFLALGYAFGFRKHEMLSMRVQQVDLEARKVFLPAGATKNGRPRHVLLAPGSDALRLIGLCVRGKAPQDHVFCWPSGKPVKDFRRAWERLTKAAGVPGLLVHDLRRSAARNLVRAGVPRSVAQRITGHLTPAIFDQYDVAGDIDLEAAAKMVYNSLTRRGRRST